MNDKEKQIKEIVRFMDTHIMAKKIVELIPSKIVSYDGRSKGQHLYIEQKMEIAKEMMKQGVVVLTMEEYKSLTNELDKGDYGEFESGYAQARKQASIELSEKVKTKIKELKQRYHEDCINGLGDEEYNGLTENNVDEILKEIGVNNG